MGVVVAIAGALKDPLLARPGVLTRPVTGVTPSELALAWRRDDHRPLIDAYVTVCQQAITHLDRS